MRTGISFNRKTGPASSLPRWFRILGFCFVAAVPVFWSLWIAIAATTRTWTGGGIINPNPALRNLWSTPQNWTTGIPAAGDDLVFPANANQPISKNDLAAGTAFNSITINGQQLTGNNIGLTHLTGTSGLIQFSSIKLMGDFLFNPQAPGNIVVNSAIDTNGRFLVVEGDLNATITGVISNSGGLLFSPFGGLTLTADNTYTGETHVNSGRLRIEGDQPTSKILMGNGTLEGSGTVGAISSVCSVGTVSPGGGIDNVLAVKGDVSLDCLDFEVDKRGPSGNLQYGQLDVTGEVHLTGTSLNVIVSSRLAAGETFTIIKNDLTDPIHGTFLGKPEGSTFTVNGVVFFISYKGGDGNDVVLHVPDRKEWTGAGPNNLWTTGSNWRGGDAPLPGDDLRFGDGASQLTNVNDFPAGTVLRHILISNSGYHLGGNALSLTEGLSDISSAANNSVEVVSLRLSGGQQIATADNGNLSIKSQIIIDSGLLDLEGNIFIGGGVTGAGGMRVLSGSVRVAGNTTNNFTGPTLIASGRVSVFAALPNSQVQINGGVLNGSGPVNSILGTGGTIFQDNESGALTSNGNVTLNAATSFEAQLFHFGSSTSNGSLTVGGTLNLGNSVLVADPDFSQPLPAGTTFKIINKTSAGAVQGTFNNLPEGTLLPVGVAVLRISYVGGDGNDVTLTVPSTRTWDGGGTTNNWTEAANWVGDVAPGAGDDLLFPAKVAQLTNNNDFPAGTTFNSIAFSGSPYTLNGNAITLTHGINDAEPSTSNTVRLTSIKLGSDQTFLKAGPPGALIVNIPIDTNGKTLLLDGSGLKLLSGPITGTGGLINNGKGPVNVLGGVTNTFSGPTVINSGTFSLHAPQTNSQVQLKGGDFFGSTAVNSIVASAGTIHSELVTTTSSGSVTLSSAATFEIAIRRVSNLASSGDFVVNGALDLGNSTLKVDPSFLVAPSAADTFTLIRKTSAGPVLGNFNGLPEGARLMVGGFPFRVSYASGEGGNDVVLIADNQTVQFNASLFVASEGDQRVSLTITRSGDTSGTASVGITTSDAAGSQNCNIFNGNASARCDYTIALGIVQFAAGEASKVFSIPIVDDSYAEGNENFTVTLSNPSGAFLGLQPTSTVTIVDNDNPTGPNPVVNSDFFVRQHYLDFLNREPDQSGFGFWTGTINSCGADQQCVEVRRINLSAAFYLSIEFQETGYLVERLYKTAYGDATGTSTSPSAHQLSVPIVRFNEFLHDTQQIGRGVVVGQGNWEQILENNKQAFIAEFITSGRFLSAFPSSLTPTQVVDKLNQNAGNVLSPAGRLQLINDLTSGAKTIPQVLRAVAEDPDLKSAEFNRAFVLMQFFGYLRRNPDDPQDHDYTGYDFWLNKLNQFNGNAIDAEMVKAFITSIEYRQRFGPI